MTDGRLLKGEQTRRTILGRAADIASAEGLEGVSIGRLATELRISKSGVFTHFGSKEELQLATVRLAVETFREHVVAPALAVPEGMRRVRALCAAWQRYQRERVFPGGCFFYSTAAEFDARPGRVRDAIAASQRDWGAFLERCLSEARDLGEIDASADPAQLAFEIDALCAAGGAKALLHDDPSGYTRAERALAERLAAVTVPAGDG
ncbi:MULTISPECIES: TetR/AcrR family transcriptional regulator [Thermomonosporaceae]|uniref:TetR/AcrR family transcriptional regulator n=1 Tax=Thermomonosporaceae TaxID=2012 RepID=UPI00255AD1C8|nr:MULTISPECIES: TetR/AcrR family transcriptional regulator [Thermomonosporaceae]MDL4774739.1 TetR/AcrR family transcriptional regulator [Actinomadura xylanilytica]